MLWSQRPFGFSKSTVSSELANKAANLEQFEEAVGMKPEADLAQPTEKYKDLPENLADAKAVALAEHPLLKARKANVDAAKSAAKEVDGAFHPQVALELRGAENDNIGGTRGNDDAYSAMVVVNWNVFRGGADDAAKSARLFEAAQAERFID